MGGGNVRGVSYGFTAIDKATQGAKPGQLVIIAARPSQGKSALMGHLVRNMAKEAPVGVITIESDEDELTLRLLAGESRMDSRILMAGNLANMDKKTLAQGGTRLSEFSDNVWVYDQAGIRLNQVQSVARKMANNGIKVLFIDYLQLIRIAGKETKREEVAEVSTSLKALARELKICIVALAQLSRDADERRPGMGDLQHSSQPEQDADQIWLIYHQKDSEGKILKSKIILEKVRDGATMDVPIVFERNTLNFFEQSTMVQ
jgi:replicative DNA helicase